MQNHKFQIGQPVKVISLISKKCGKILLQDRSYGLPTYMVRMDSGEDLCVHESELVSNI